ncbi:MAG TPA: hypothetical protein VN673_17810 [Clostridia bacterium]|nr:hypothetical protein [Clostridia bacterium]
MNSSTQSEKQLEHHCIGCEEGVNETLWHIRASKTGPTSVAPEQVVVVRPITQRSWGSVARLTGKPLSKNLSWNV